MVGLAAVAATTFAAGRALDLVAEERREETLLITPVDPVLSIRMSLEDQSRVDKTCGDEMGTSDVNTLASSWAFGITVRNDGSTRGVTHGRGRVQESDSMRCILVSEIEPEPSHGPSMWKTATCHFLSCVTCQLASICVLANFDIHMFKG